MRQRWADYRVFWRQFRDAYYSTGAVLPSGRGLARALTHFVRGEANGSVVATDATKPRRILEVGPGTGAVTEQIIADMRINDRLVLVERNLEFVSHLEQRLSQIPKVSPNRDRISLLHSSVEDVPNSESF